MKKTIVFLFLILCFAYAALSQDTRIYSGGNVTQIINPSSSGTHTLKTGGANITLDPGGGKVSFPGTIDTTGTFLFPRKTDPASPVTGEGWINVGSIKIRDNAATPITRELFTLEGSQTVTGFPKIFKMGSTPTNGFQVCDSTGTKCGRLYHDGTNFIIDTDPVQDAITRLSVGRKFSIQNSASANIFSIAESLSTGAGYLQSDASGIGSKILTIPLATDVSGTLPIANTHDDVMRVLNRNTTDVSATAAAETSVYSFSVPANTLGTNRNIVTILTGTLTTGATPGNITVQTKYGVATATSTALALTANFASVPWVMKFWLSADGGTAAQLLNHHFICSDNAGNNCYTGVGSIKRAAGTVDSTLAATLDVTITFSATGNTLTKETGWSMRQ